MNSNLLIISIIVFHLIILMRKDFQKGLRVSVFYLVFLPHSLRIETPGFFPEFTIHRIIVIILILFSKKNHQFTGFSENTPFLKIILAVLLMQIGSLVFSIDFELSMKNLFANIFENYLLFFIIVNCVKTPEDAVSLLKTTVLGIGLAAGISFFEYYKGVNFIGALVPEHGYFSATGAVGSYQHPIHLGYIMAMAFPVSFILIEHDKRLMNSIVYLAITILIVSSCYFSQSRGPWGVALLTGFLLFPFGSKRIRRNLAISLLFLLAFLTIKAGVRETVTQSLLTVMPNNNSKIEDASVEYRLKLWTIAFDKTNASFTRWLFGYGGLSTSLMDISGYFGSQRGGQVMDQGFSSWDSAWASHLVQFGWLGLATEFVLQVSIMFFLLKSYRKNSLIAFKDISATTLIGCIVYNLSMLTVSIFSPQMKYLYWTFVGTGIVLGRFNQHEQVEKV